MIDVLVFSDSHGNVLPMRRAISVHPRASYVLFCGDGVRDIESLEEEFPDKIFLAVKGNCDLFVSENEISTERVVPIGGYRILMMHGHLYGVKGGYGVAAVRAASENANILIFGHTHLPYDGRLETGGGSVHLFNPGSIGRRLDGGYSYGILTIGDNGYLFSHGKQDG